MNTKNESNNQENYREYTVYLSGGYLISLIRAVTAGVTGVVTLFITVIVTFLVVTGGLALAYIYLPASVFNLIAIILAADILLGIALRAVLRRRTQKRKMHKSTFNHNTKDRTKLGDKR